MGREIKARNRSRSLAATVLIFVITILSIEVVVLLVGSNSWLSSQDEVTNSFTGPCEIQKQISVKQDTGMDGSTRRRLKIAVMSSFVPNRGTVPPPRLKSEYFDHLINKGAYDSITDRCYFFAHQFTPTLFLYSLLLLHPQL
jgi:hypothetical protein